ncbi:flagellar assembly protein FliW [Bacillus sp. V3-13]|uniref:flagellar assembly protein FliW n=1 Tax=Bacillus sp. V3-13 TaxID=2053728 RepID=UPI000C76DA28|nr:flagellar assembly protein FliW [Bacillus sp. V3-13]PLR78243.1 flagellar assembly protein FliW [Bacillus sp. V3-13]
MKVKTRYHGELELDQEVIISFPNGVPGFPDDKNYFIIPLDENSPFAILQSVQTEGLGFVIADPFSFYKDYEFELPQSFISQFKIDDKKDINIYSIVTVKDSIDTSTINLQAPIIINNKTKSGKQVILNTDAYHTKHPLKQHNKQTGQEG